MTKKFSQGFETAFSWCAKQIQQGLRFLYQHRVLTVVLVLSVLLLSLWGMLYLEVESDTRKFLPQNTAERRASERIKELYDLDSEMIIAYTASDKQITNSTVRQTVRQLTADLQALRLDTEPPAGGPTSGEEPSDLLGDTDLLGETLGETSAGAAAESDLLGTLSADAATAAQQQLDISSYPLIQDLQSLDTATIMERQGAQLEQLEMESVATPDRAAEQSLQQSLRTWALYDKALYSDDFQYGAIVIQPRIGLSSAQHYQLYQKVVAAIAAYQGSGIRFFLSGEDVIQSVIGDYILKDLIWLLPLLSLVICAVLYWHFRRVSALFIILFPVSFSLIITIGLMGWLGVKFTFIHASIPVIIMALGSADSIHTLSHFLHQDRQKNLWQRIAGTQSTLLKPITLTSITTSIGFLSFASSIMVPIRSFGIFSAVGISLAWLASVLLTPLLLPLAHRAKPTQTKTAKTAKTAEAAASTKPAKQQSRGFAAYTTVINTYLLRYPVLSRIVLLLLTCALLVGIPYVPINNDTITYFRPSSPVVVASKVINKELGGIYSMHISISSPQEGGMAEPEILQYMQKLADYIRRENPQVVNKTIGLQDFVLQISRLLNDKGSGFPADRQTAIQYLSLFSGNLDSFVSPDIYAPQSARLSVYLKNGDKDTIHKVLANIADFRAQFLPENYQQLESGYSMTVNSLNKIVVREQIQSIVIAIVGVLLVVWLSFGSFGIGILSCLPIIVTLLVNSFLMAVLQIDLNISTALINSLVIGVGIDYSIHLISCYQQNLPQQSGAKQKIPPKTKLSAVRRALQQVSSSIMLNALSVGFGYSVLLFSQFRSLGYFGGLSALANIIAAVLALVVVPFMLAAGRRTQAQLYPLAE